MRARIDRGDFQWIELCDPSGVVPRYKRVDFNPCRRNGLPPTGQVIAKGLSHIVGNRRRRMAAITHVTCSFK